MAQTELTKKASDYIYRLFKEHLPQSYVYHNYNHTLDVVKSTKEIGKKSDLDDTQMEIVMLAAWFHDSGYTEAYDGHEEKGAELARAFLEQNNFPSNKIELVLGCIRATKYPPEPKNLIEEVVCDADVAHIAKDDYIEKSDILRTEWERCQNKTFSDVDWMKLQVDFISEHRFFTKYAKKEFEDSKLSHLIKLKKQYKKMLEQKQQDEKKDAKLELEKEKFTAKKEAEKKAERGIETMFRNTVRTHVEFSGMADGKANIMISINTLIIGIIVTSMLRKLAAFPQLVIPTFILLSVCLTCIIFAVLVTRPKITAGTFTKQEIYDKKTNLLFFGNFFKMNLSDFEWGMHEMMYDKDYLYGSMIKDFYFLGQVLGKKYKYLRMCYTIFMYGIILAVLAYAIAFILNPGPTNLDLID